MYFIIILIIIICINIPSTHAGGDISVDVSIFNLNNDYPSDEETTPLFYDDAEKDKDSSNANDTNVSIFDLYNQENIKAAYGRDLTPGKYTKEDLAYYTAANAEKPHKVKGIVCFGDSLTAGTGGYGINYPQVLSDYINEEIMSETETYENVVNMGFSGEDAVTIPVRAGSIRMLITKDFTIPADNSRVEIEFKTASEKKIIPLHSCKVKINGIPGTINSDNATKAHMEKNIYYFKRNVNCSSYEESDKTEVAVEAGTQVIFDSADNYKKYIPVIFMGQNGGFNSPQELIAMQRSIIDYYDCNDKFIIVGLHTGTKFERSSLEAAMVEEYGDHYINLREYMSTDALYSTSITPTAEDLNAMLEGRTPPSLLFDSVHFKEIGYEIIGKLIYDRMKKLGYFDEYFVKKGKKLSSDIEKSYTIATGKISTIRLDISKLISNSVINELSEENINTNDGKVIFINDEDYEKEHENDDSTADNLGLNLPENQLSLYNNNTKETYDAYSNDALTSTNLDILADENSEFESSEIQISDSENLKLEIDGKAKIKLVDYEKDFLAVHIFTDTKEKSEIKLIKDDKIISKYRLVSK